jgi:hypothetical protein
MTPIPEQAEQDVYRLVLMSPQSLHCLADFREGSLRLPRLTISRRPRPAYEISRVINTLWNADVLVLDCFVARDQNSKCVVAELLKPAGEPLLGESNVWCSVPDLTRGELTGTEISIVESLADQDSSGTRPFSRIGWLHKAIAWIKSVVPSERFEFSGQLQQFNASVAFSLIRLGNNRGPSYWLKAVSEPNLHELPITEMLAGLFPTFLPVFVAARPDWSAWIMEDAGKCLTVPLQGHQLESTVKSLAELQISSIGFHEELLSAGCYDHRAFVLREHIPKLIDYLVDAMFRQTSTRAPRLSESRLREVGSILAEACSKLDALKLPVTLLHNDIGFGNILLRDTGAAFIDWAEACVGVPTVTYQHLRHYVARENNSSVWLDNLDATYKRSWKCILSDSQIDNALILSPLIALCSHLFGRGKWSIAQDIDSEASLRYARGLARHMDRAAAAPELMEVLCH